VDLAEATGTGACMTLVACVTCSVLFFCEVSAFLSAKPRTDVVLDSNQDSELRINFDVSMLDMACDHVTVGVWDAFGTERMNITRNVMKTHLDHNGASKGRPYTEDELVALEFMDQTFSGEEQKELDSDWSSSSDQFHHDDFQSVIDAHDHTFVNFYADWCPHCRAFGPIWNAFEEKLNSAEAGTWLAHSGKYLETDDDIGTETVTLAEAKAKCLTLPGCVGFTTEALPSTVDTAGPQQVWFKSKWKPAPNPTWTSWQVPQEPVVDADGAKANVRVLKINCVDFEETCQQQKVHSFPTVRLYRRGFDKKQFVDFRGRRDIADLEVFARGEVKKLHRNTGAKFHEVFSEGCRIQGFVEVARVPGTVHFQAMHTADRTLNLAFTNVSHQVHSFTFGDEPAKTQGMLPEEYSRHAAPLDGKTFSVDRFHQAPHHFIKVVHTRFEESDLRSYQQTHQWSVRSIQRKTVPQAKFSYDLSPVEVVIRKGDRRWYDFVTSIFAIIGGAFTVMSMTSGVLNVASTQFKRSINKIG